jgi:hypothetical protein
LKQRALKVKKKYIVFSIEGQGGCWWYIYAKSAEEIERVLPEFYVFRETPRRFNKGAREWAERMTFDLENPTGLLKNYLENRQPNNAVFQNPCLKGDFKDC